MKKATLALLSVGALASMTSLASATPVGVNDFISSGGLGISQTAQNGASSLAEHAQNIGPTVSQAAQNGGISSLNTQVQSVPEPGTLLLFGVGFLALALWNELRQRRA
jgi:hypothetical protein